jgi:hypothetical protein
LVFPVVSFLLAFPPISIQIIILESLNGYRSTIKFTATATSELDGNGVHTEDTIPCLSHPQPEAAYSYSHKKKYPMAPFPHYIFVLLKQRKHINLSILMRKTLREGERV